MSDNSESWWNMSLLLCQPWLLHFLSEMLCFDSRFAPMSLDMHQISASTAKTATPMPVTKVGGATLDISQPFLFFVVASSGSVSKSGALLKATPSDLLQAPPYFHSHLLIFTTIALCSLPFPYFHNHVLIFATVSLFSQQFPNVHSQFIIFTTISLYSKPFPYFHTDFLISTTIFAIFTTIFVIFSTIWECPIKS